MTNYLITGSSGLIANEIIKLLSSDDNAKIFCQSRSSSMPKHLIKFKDKIEWINVDLSTPITSELLNEIDVVFHLSAQTSVYKAREDTIKDLNSNFLDGVRLLEFCKNKDIAFIFAGSATQKGFTKDITINNTTSNPETFYDLHKTLLEMYLIQFIKEKWIKGCILKLANVYGARLDSQSNDRGVLDKVFNKAKKNENIEIYGGNFYRDYIHIKDVANAFIHASKNIKKCNAKSYFIATGQSIKLKDAFQSVIDIASKKYNTQPSIEYKEMPSNFYLQESRSVKYDIQETIKDLDWTPKISFIEGIKQTYEQ